VITALLGAALFALTQNAPDSAPDQTPPAPPPIVAMILAEDTSSDAFEQARRDVRDAAQAGDPAAQRLMGSLTRGGYAETPPDAETWFRRSMAGDDASESARAAFLLAGHLRAQGDRGAEVRALLEGLTQAPDDIATDIAGYLGADYLFGLGGDVRPTEGEAYLNSAIAMGFNNPDILEAYADTVIERDRERAVTLLRRAADAGSPSAAWRFAMGWMQGGGDPITAYRYVTWAAGQDHREAQVSRAVMLATGQGVAQDLAAARAAYLVPARQGSAHAWRGLGVMYLAGQGGPVDAATGYALLELAARAGDDDAAAILETPPDAFADRPDQANIETAGDAWLAGQALE
jgi:TPR repeat protein